MNRNYFQERTTDKQKDYNWCYFYDYDGNWFIKDPCRKCDLCQYDDKFGKCKCVTGKLCEHG